MRALELDCSMQLQRVIAVTGDVCATGHVLLLSHARCCCLVVCGHNPLWVVCVDGAPVQADDAASRWKGAKADDKQTIPAYVPTVCVRACC